MYDFNALALPAIKATGSKQVLGIQANLWTETIADNHQLDFMLFPRIAALAEAAWTPVDQKNYAQFSSNLQQHFLLYKQKNVNYYDPAKK